MAESGQTAPTQAISVAVGIIRSGNDVLIGIRQSGTVLAGKHEFPGGKCHAGESPEVCVVRECLEETGLAVEVVELWDCRCHTYDHGTIALNFFVCRPGPLAGSLNSDRFRWIPVHQLAELDFPEANRDVVRRLMESVEVGAHPGGGANPFEGPANPDSDA